MVTVIDLAILSVESCDFERAEGMREEGEGRLGFGLVVGMGWRWDIFHQEVRKDASRFFERTCNGYSARNC